MLSGIAIGYIGNSRPASGSEHHIAHFWEMMSLLKEKEGALHGERVGVAEIAVLKLYEMLLDKKLDFEKIKSFFIEEDEETTEVKQQPKAETVSFPVNNVVTQNTQVNYVTPQNGVSNRFLTNIMGVYDTTFNKLNQPGYDFFEFYKAINTAGVDNVQMYPMAFQMAQAMDNTITKDLLVNTSDYYISEIEKVHKSFSEEGNSKMLELTNNKTTETQTLTSDIINLKDQMTSLNELLKTKEENLYKIDSKYTPQLNDISEKLSANDIAKDTLISNIKKVKTNIETNLK